jgi:hypothetical protein
MLPQKYIIGFGLARGEPKQSSDFHQFFAFGEQ